MAPTATKDVKEESEDTKTVKTEKRKKSDGASKSEKEPIAKQVKTKTEVKEEVPPPNIYQEILEMECRESESRPADKDHKLWVETCGELRGMMKDIYELKQKKSSASEITEKRIQASLLFVTLKKLNRLEKLRIKRCRDITAQSKQGVDSFNLQLQNLLYEVLHLRKEVDKCVHFKSADEALSLIPEEQFFTEAPTDISRPEVTREDDHSLRLARLEWELARRKELGDEASKGEEERDVLETNIRQREDKLRELQPQLASILETTKPVQEYLGLPLDYRREQTSLARLLPDPLYILYTQVLAYSEACDQLVEVKVTGDMDEAKKVREELNKGVEDEDSQGEEVTEQDSQDQDTELMGKKNRRGKSVGKTQDDKKAKLLVQHPLSVRLTVKTKASGDQIILVLGYLPGLGVVVVQVQLGLQDSSLSGMALQVSSILSHLYPEDCGTRSPNPVNEYQLSRVGLSEPLSTLLSDNCHPYRWAQKLAGLDFLNCAPGTEGGPPSRPSPSFSKLHLESTLGLLRARLVARTDLQLQLTSLARSKPVLSDLLPTDLADIFPVRTQSRLRSWTPMDWETYSREEFSKHLIQHKVVDENDFFFKAQCNRDKAILTALVTLKPTYPAEAPIFCLSLTQGDQVQNLANSEMIREVEAELNTGWEDQLGLEGKVDRPGLLALMLHRLLVLLDLVLEVGTEGGSFTKSQVWQSQVRGRMRSLPLCYNRELQSFQQR